MTSTEDTHTLLEDVFYVVLVIHIYRYQKGGRGGAVQIYLSILKGMGGLKKAKI